MKTENAFLIGVVLFLVLAVYFFVPFRATFSGSHTIYKMRNSSVEGDAFFCAKCHPAIVGRISTARAHNLTTGCLCHGYYPNYTNLGGYNVSVNLKHNLTKNVYCTNCHTRYDSNTGNVTTYNVSGVIIQTGNQSAHYIYFNDSNKTEIYDRAKTYLEGNF
jgi:hypothetical protein